jgi:multidrug resistance protein MdtO
MVAGLVTTGAMKQKLTHRLIGATAGGLVLGIGAEVFLFPFMDSITSLVVVIGAVAFLSAWIVQGSRFSYVGIQVGFAFYLTSLAGFAAPTALAPARDRLAGIMLGVLVMWFVFDQVWPVRTIAQMRLVAASVLKDVSRVVALTDTRLSREDHTKEMDGLRARLAKQLSTIRALNDAAEYEFGADREDHIRAGDKLTEISMTAVALAWTHAALPHERDEGEALRPPEHVKLREAVAQGLSSMADALEQKQPMKSKNLDGFDPGPIAAGSDSEYAWNTISRYSELQTLALSLEWPD